MSKPEVTTIRFFNLNTLQGKAIAIVRDKTRAKVYRYTYKRLLSLESLLQGWKVNNTDVCMTFRK